MHLATILALFALWGLFRLLGMDGWSEEKYDLSALPFHLLLIHSWGFLEQNSWNIPSWSISAEFAAYLLFPLLMTASLKMRPRIGLVAALIAFFVTWLGVLLTTGQEPTKLQLFGIPRILPAFLLGVALRRLNITGVPSYWLVILLGATMVSVQLSASDMPTVLLLAALVPAVASLNAPKSLVYLGDASYSLYMVHSLVQTLYFNALLVLGIQPNDPVLSIGIMLGGVVAAVLVSIVAYENMEIPARSWLTHHFNRHRPCGGVGISERQADDKVSRESGASSAKRDALP